MWRALPSFLICYTSCLADDKPVSLRLPDYFPKPDLPTDNALTEKRISLGERLFHDAILSEDARMSCLACHSPVDGFSDPRQFSEGINGHIGTRHSMTTLNLAWKNSFFWDGRVTTLREQVLHPISDPKEMALPLRYAVARLNRSKSYRQEFKDAYGVDQVTEEKLALALENYLLSHISVNSKYDDVLQRKATLTPEEEAGRQLFFTKYDPASSKRGASCFECHNGPLFSDFAFRNNGLKTTADLGRFGVTKVPDDRGKFVTPSLRNVALTAPYMHDGRLKTLEDVLKHYSSPFTDEPTLDPILKAHASTGLNLTEVEQKQIIAFLKTLSDPEHE